MSAENNQLRDGLSIRRAPLPAPLIYRVTGDCYYQSDVDPIRGEAAQRPVQMGIRRGLENLLFVSGRDGSHIFTALIQPDGKIHSFNIEDDDGSKLTDRSFYERSLQKLKPFQQRWDATLRQPHVLNELSLFLPEFSSLPRNAGDYAATVTEEDGSPWAIYKYRGLTQVDGVDAAVFDLTRIFPNHPEYGPSLVGFSVVDLRTMMPIRLVLDAGTQVRLERTSCTSSSR